MIELYDRPRCGDAHKVRNMLSLLGVDYERVPVDATTRAGSRPGAAEGDAVGRLPVLVDDGLAIREASAILVYLGRKYGRGKWLPVDAVGEARVAEWLATAASEVADGPARARAIEVLGGEGEIESARRRAHRVFERFDRHLAERAWLAGRAPTIADVANYSDLALAPEGGLAIDRYRNVLRWFERLSRLPGFETVRCGDDDGREGAG